MMRALMIFGAALLAKSDEELSALVGDKELREIEDGKG